MREVWQTAEDTVVIRDFIVVGSGYEFTRYREYTQVTKASIARLERLWVSSDGLMRAHRWHGFMVFAVHSVR